MGNRMYIILGIILCMMGCTHNTSSEKKDTLFELMPTDITGISFKNTLKYDEKFNVYTYRNYYNGGGVSIGDINNDGLSDIYFTSNLGPNKLYLNKGNFQFEAVSYTHLRAHETDSYIVCRLLLEKKHKH